MAAVEMEDDNRQDKDEDDDDPEEDYDEKEAGLSGRLLLDARELLFQLFLNVLHAAGKLFRKMVLVAHVVLDAELCSGAV